VNHEVHPLSATLHSPIANRIGETDVFSIDRLNCGLWTDRVLADARLDLREQELFFCFIVK
jgi:hypothetical protein